MSEKLFELYWKSNHCGMMLNHLKCKNYKAGEGRYRVKENGMIRGVKKEGSKNRENDKEVGI